MGFTEGSGHQDNKRGGWLLVLGLGLLVLIIVLASGCATVESGRIVDKHQEAGSTQYECKGTGEKRKCGWDTDPPSCMFQLDNGTEKGWVKVDCTEHYPVYEIGNQYP